MNFDQVVTSVKSLLFQWKQQQRNGMHEIFPLGVSSSSVNSSKKVLTNVLVQKVGLALQTFLQTKFNNSVSNHDFMSVFKQCLSTVLQGDQELFSSILNYFPPEWSYLAPSSLTGRQVDAANAVVDYSETNKQVSPHWTTTLDWKEFEKIILSLQRKVTVETKPIFLVPETDSLKLYEAKKLQIEAKSDTYWPFLRSQFPVDTSFFHYASILDKSFQLVQKRYPSSIRQSDIFQPADFVKKEPIFVQAALPSSFGSVVSKSTTLLQRLAASGNNEHLSSSTPSTPKLPTISTSSSIYSSFVSSATSSAAPTADLLPTKGRKRKLKQYSTNQENKDPNDASTPLRNPEDAAVENVGVKKPKQSRRKQEESVSTSWLDLIPASATKQQIQKQALHSIRKFKDHDQNNLDQDGEDEEETLNHAADSDTLPCSFEELAYGLKEEETVEETGTGYHKRKLIRLTNPILAACPPLSELHEELFSEHDAFNNRKRINGRESSEPTDHSSFIAKPTYTIQELIHEYPYNHGSELESTYIVDPSLISRVIRQRFALRKETDIYLQISGTALRALSDGIQMHLRNIVESALRVNQSTDSSFQLATRNILLPCMTIPRFQKPKEKLSNTLDCTAENDSARSVVVAYDIDMLHQARKIWESCNKTVPIPALPVDQKGFRFSNVAACLQEERLDLMTTAAKMAEVMKEQIKTHLDAKQMSEGSVDHQIKLGLVHFTESLAQLKSQEEKQQQHQEKKYIKTEITANALRQVILKHSSVSFLPVGFRNLLIMQKESMK